MRLHIQKSLVAVLVLAILLPLLSFTISKITPIDPKVARADAISRIENVEDMDISLNRSLAGNANTQSLNSTSSKNDIFVNGEVLVKFKSVQDKNSFAQQNGAIYNPASTSTLARLQLGDSYDMKMTQDAIANLSADSRVQYAEPNFIGFANSVPNDTYYDKQWYLKNNADFALNSKQDFDINLEPARDITTGIAGTVVAIIDQNVNFPATPEIADSILRDANGKVIGKNIALNCDYTDATGVLSPSCDITDPTSDHGTLGAGLIAAKTNDSNGVAGVCPGCKIMPIGISDRTNISMISAINFAIANGADIITTSISFNVLASQLNTLNTAVQNAITGGVFVVATAGNCGYTLSAEGLVNNNCKVASKQNSNYPICLNTAATAAEKLSASCIAPNEYQYPGSFDGVVSVSGFDSNGENLYLTANDKVKISAPGIELLTATANTAECSATIKSNCCNDRFGLTPTDKLCYVSGTSFSAPIVAGVLGLVKSKFPDSTPQNYDISKLGREAGQFVYTQNPSLSGKMGIGAINACGALGGCVGSANALTGYSFGTPNPNVVDPISGKIGGLFPMFSLASQTFPSQTIVKFVPAGCTDIAAITGKIQSNAFVPDVGSLIPTCSTLGVQNGSLKYTSIVGSSNVNIQTNVNTNFVGSTSAAPILGLSNTTIAGVVGTSLITIPLTNNTLNNGIYIFIPAGCEDSSQPIIKGTIIDSSFIANVGEVIPSCATTGPNAGTLDAILGTDTSTAQSIGVLTNFTTTAVNLSSSSIAQISSSLVASSSSISLSSANQSSNVIASSPTVQASSSSIASSNISARSSIQSQTISSILASPSLISSSSNVTTPNAGSGATIVIRTQQDNIQGSVNATQASSSSLSNSNSMISSTALTSNSTISVNKASAVVQLSKSYNNGSFKSKITIEDPYTCGKGVLGNVPNSKKLDVDFVYYEFYKPGSTVSSYSFKLKLNDNGDFFLPISPTTNIIADGNYRMVYYAYDNEGNKAQGEYNDYISSDCGSPKLSKNSVTVRSGGFEIVSISVLILSILALVIAYNFSKSKQIEFK